ncbi:MAG TPA: ABC transporter substrate-binding protein [Candidatus Sulfotelmatobacter sp.]|nr:ABC transporter substrate-binding protein [Candidatus Sulfotelmatobacter sp.]
MNFANAAALFVAAVFCLCGCGKKSETEVVSSENSATNYPLPDPPYVAPAHPGNAGGRFIVATWGDPKSFNPITANEVSSLDISRFLFASLLGYDYISQEVEPGLADSWTHSPDGKTWMFHLRKNLRWSDGAPLTAEDVAFTWNDIVFNPKIVSPTRDLFIINGKAFTVTNLDDLTIQVTTPEVYAPFLENFGGVPILPKHVLQKSVADGTFDSAYSVNWKPEDIVGSGPFRLKAYATSQYALLERNPYFFEVDSNGQRLPYFDDIAYTIVPDKNTISLRFLSGECDVNDFIFPHQYDEYKAKAATGNFRLLEPGTGLETDFLWFNQNTNVNPHTGKPYVDPVKLKWFRNVKFRQAVSYAINREALVQSVYAGRAVPNYGFITPGNKKWYDPNIMTYPYNPDKARELLKEIGMEDRKGDGFLEDADGHPVEFIFNTDTDNDSRMKAAVLILQDFKKIGFHVTFQPLDFNTQINKLDSTYDYECVLMGLGAGGTDPSSDMNVFKSSGFTHLWFPQEKSPSTDWEARIDTLMDDQMQTLDTATRRKEFDEVQEILAREQPVIFTVTPEYFAAIRSDVGNVRASALSYYRATWNIEELYFKK